MHRRVAGGPVYISVGIDVLDPAHAQGTGTPSRPEGCDVARVADHAAWPGRSGHRGCRHRRGRANDHAEITGIAAAHVGYELLSVMAKRGSLVVAPSVHGQNRAT
ncbi:arginase family protein [Gordonia sp. DT101]|uniref:arginase family protein n=1 Tax=Gordonia sp. DT101 TaxID=3416545 RepID=UPI003CEA82B7